MNIDQVKDKLAQRAPFQATEKPAAFAAVPENMINELDVRDDLRTGNEPFSRIMAAQAAVPQGGILRLRAIFEPLPLYGVLGRQGFSHWTEKLADDDWRVWFYKGDSAQAAPPTQPSHASVPEADLVVLDVRGLEPPEPMERTLEALSTLPEGKALLQINARVPQFLIPMLDERGFEYVIVREEPNEVRGLIRRKGVAQAEKQLDVRVIPPREKHPAIFQTFDALDVGSYFVLVNDHDPFPLRYQFEAERTNRFTWDYLEKGPVVWRVRIGKTA